MAKSQRFDGITRKEVVDATAIAAAVGVPTILWGGVGLGKTATMYALGAALGKAYNVPVKTLCVIACLREPTDFLGFPFISEGVMHYGPPNWIVQAQKFVDENPNGLVLILFDELTTADPSTQNALLRGILEGVFGDVALPANVRYFAAANPPEIAAEGFDLSLPLANRFLHLNYGVTPKEFATYLRRKKISISLQEGIRHPLISDAGMEQIPVVDFSQLPQAHAKWANLVATYIEHVAPTALVSSASDEDRAFATPRSWDYYFITLMAATDAAYGLTNAIRITSLHRILACGSIGAGTALPFLEWAENLNLPQIDAILANPNSFVIPAREDQLAFIINSLVSHLADVYERNSAEVGDVIFALTELCAVFMDNNRDDWALALLSLIKDEANRHKEQIYEFVLGKRPDRPISRRLIEYLRQDKYAKINQRLFERGERR